MAQTIETSKSNSFHLQLPEAPKNSETQSVLFDHQQLQKSIQAIRSIKSQQIQKHAQNSEEKLPQKEGSILINQSKHQDDHQSVMKQLQKILTQRSLIQQNSINKKQEAIYDNSGFSTKKDESLLSQNKNIQKIEGEIFVQKKIKAQNQKQEQIQKQKKENQAKYSAQQAGQKLKMLLQRQIANEEQFAESSESSFSDMFHKKNERENKLQQQSSEEKSQIDIQFLEEIQKNKQILQTRRKQSQKKQEIGLPEYHMKQLKTIIETSLTQQDVNEQSQMGLTRNETQMVIKLKHQGKLKKNKKKQKLELKRLEEGKQKNLREKFNKLDSMYDRRVKDYNGSISENKFLSKKKADFIQKNDPVENSKKAVSKYLTFGKKQSGDIQEQQSVKIMNVESARKKMSLKKSPSVPDHIPPKDLIKPKKEELHLPLLQHKKFSSKSLFEKRMKIKGEEKSINIRKKEEQNNLFDTIHNILLAPGTGKESQNLPQQELKNQSSSKKNSLASKNKLTLKDEQMIAEKKKQLNMKIQRLQNLLKLEGEKDYGLLDELNAKVNSKLLVFDARYKKKEKQTEQINSEVEHGNTKIIDEELKKVQYYYENNEKSLKHYINSKKYLHNLQLS